VLLLCAIAVLILFAWLQINNQSQTKYLIFFDFWRNYAHLQIGDDIYEYLSHNVHTYVVASAIWYLDILFSSGDLGFLHLYVNSVSVAAIYGLFLWSLQQNNQSISTFPAAIVASVAASLWLSPANGECLNFPLVDVFGATALLLLCITGILAEKISSPSETFLSKGAWVAYVVTIFLGFLTLEVFLIVPAMFALHALAYRRWWRALLHMVLAAFFGLLYSVWVPSSPASQVPVELHCVELIHNFLVLLSGHVGLLLLHCGIYPRVAGAISIGISILQLACFAYLIWASFLRNKREAGLPFPIILALFGCASILLAAWVRYPNTLIYEPVYRYVMYAIMFSMALVLQAFAVQSAGILDRLVRAVVVLIIVGYLAAEASALILLGHNAGVGLLMARLEMATYAQTPGRESGLGPSEPDGGKRWRFGLHSFLETKGWSVFGSDGYRSLGTVIPQSIITKNSTCKIADRTADRTIVTGIDNSGVVLITDASKRVIGFSFTAQNTPLSPRLVSLRPFNMQRGIEIYWVQAHAGQLSQAMLCG